MGLCRHLWNLSFSSWSQTDIFAETKGSEQWKVTPGSYWCLCNDIHLSLVGLRVSSLCASSTSVKRVWSPAAFQGADCERLTTAHLSEEVYIWWNCPKLKYKPLTHKHTFLAPLMGEFSGFCSVSPVSYISYVCCRCTLTCPFDSHTGLCFSFH